MTGWGMGPCVPDVPGVQSNQSMNGCGGLEADRLGGRDPTIQMHREGATFEGREAV